MTYEQKIQRALAYRLVPLLRTCAEFEARHGRLPTLDELIASYPEKASLSPPTLEEAVQIANSTPLKEIVGGWLVEAERCVAAYDEAASRPA
jgi:hypothetical protein